MHRSRSLDIPFSGSKRLAVLGLAAITLVAGCISGGNTPGPTSLPMAGPHGLPAFSAENPTAVLPRLDGVEFVFKGTAAIAPRTLSRVDPSAGAVVHHFNVPQGVYRASFNLTWADGTTDLDLSALDGEGKTRCGSGLNQISDGAPPQETCELVGLHGLNTSDKAWTGRVTTYASPAGAASPVSYELHVTLIAVPLALRGPSIPTALGQGAPAFPPAPFADTEHVGGEPSVRVAPDGTIWTCAPSALGRGVASYLWKSTDGGATYRFIPIQVQGQEYALAGGDCDLAIDSANNVYMTDLWLGSNDLYSSRDGGATWTVVPLTGVPGVDRAWLAAGKANEVYMGYQQNPDSGLWVIKSTDGGITFPQQTLAVPRYVDGSRAGVPGNLAIGPKGELYLAYPSETEEAQTGGISGPVCIQPVTKACFQENQVFVAVSKDDGKTFTSHLVAKREVAVSHHFPIVAVDRAGNAYMSWAETEGKDAASETHIFLSTSKDGGATWSEPAKLTGAIPGHHMMPWLAAGDNGVLDIAWYGTPTPGDTPTTVADGEWYVYFAQSTHALDPNPSFQVTVLDSEPVHLGGLGPLDRAFLDFLQIALTPDGRAVVSFADNLHGNLPDLTRVAVQSGGALAKPLLPGEKAPRAWSLAEVSEGRAGLPTP